MMSDVVVFSGMYVGSKANSGIDVTRNCNLTNVGKS